MDDAKKDWRLTFTLTPDIEQKLVEMRKTDEFCRMSYGELVRLLLNEAFEMRRQKGA